MRRVRNKQNAIISERDPVLEIFEKATKHPEGFLVNSDAANGEILGFEIVRGAGCFAEGEGVGDENLVGVDEMCDKILGRSGPGFHFRNRGEFGECGETAWRKNVEGAEAFSDVINGCEEFLVLALKGNMKLEKARPLHVPMREMRLPH